MQGTSAAPVLVRTDRLTLHAVSWADVAAVWEVHADPRTNRFNPSGPDDAVASEQRLASWIADWRRDGVGYWAVAHGGATLGFCGVRHVERDGPVLNLYYRFAVHAWGRGFAPEAARAAVDWAARERPHRPVSVVTRPVNAPSLAVARKLGFEHYRDLEYGGAPSVEWRLPDTRAGRTSDR